MQLEWLIAIIGIIGVIAIIGFVVAFVVIGLLLGVALGPVHGENRNLGSTFVTAFFIALTYLVLLIPFGIFIFCIMIVLQWYFIKSRHEVGWGGAIVAWVITLILIAIVLVIISIVALGGILALLGGLPF
ncbi:MAG: hypothetical protein ACTSQZ_05170 [Candidatus Thorarchaeota archaeon]